MLQKLTYGLSIFTLMTISIIQSPASESKKPNVIFILADDLGYGDMSCYGATLISTPACDKLAEQGIKFTDAHSPSAVCTPSRYSILTGRYCWRSWLKNWVLQESHPLLIDTERLTMGKLFQRAGYTTGCVGKWHLGWGTELNIDMSNEMKPGPLEVGFDTFFGVPFSHNSSKKRQVYVRNRKIVNLIEGINYADNRAMKSTVRDLEGTAIDLSAEAVSFIDKNKDHPFFLYYPTTNIHFPLTPNDQFKGASKAGIYGDFVAEFDWAVQEIVDALKRNGISENTILVVTSDNGGRPPRKIKDLKAFGTHQCNGSLRGTKRHIHEGGHRIPLIVRWPEQISANTISSETVCLTDFFATFANILGQQFPNDAGEDSYDLTNVLTGKPYKSPLREATVHHSVSGQFAIRKGDWKLIEGSKNGDYPRDENKKMNVITWNPTRHPTTKEWLELDYFKLNHDDGFQLYNLKLDPKEEINLAEKHPEKVRDLYSILNKYRDNKSSIRILNE